MIIFVVFGLILVSCDVESSRMGVCEKTTTYNHTWSGKEKHTFEITYYSPEYCYWCPKKTKQGQNLIKKTFWEIRNKTQDICCEGYKGNPAYGVPCKPVCNPPCRNGFCNAPNNCLCSFGYKKSSNQTCEPHCPKGCLNGKCVGPDICICDKGYTNDKSFTCEPQCNNGCPPNQKCVKPNECQCNVGYVMSKINVCKPQCPQGCPNGKCVEPDVCECNNGYKMSENNTCEPQCSECIYGICVAPNKCSILASTDKNFEITANDTNMDHEDITESTTIKTDEFIWDSENTSITSSFSVTDYDTSNKDNEISSTAIFDDKFTKKEIDMTTSVLRTKVKNDILELQNDVENKSFPLWAYIVVVLLMIASGFLVYYKRRCLLSHTKSGSYEMEDQNNDHDIPSVHFTGVTLEEADSSHSSGTMECLH